MNPSQQQVSRAMSECGRAHGPKWLKWLEHIKDKDDVHGIEIGTFQGHSAEWMLQNIFTSTTSTYTCIDPWLPEGSADHKLMGVDCTQNERIARERLAPYSKRVTLIKEFSFNALRLPKLWHLLGGADFLYVDGAHDSMNTLRDAVFGFDYLRVGGVMVFDDYEWKVAKREEERPKIGINSFIHAYRDHLTILQPVGWQIAVKKIKA